jgi:hypothetical protein
MRFRRDRRSTAGSELARIMLDAPDAVSFDDLFDRLEAAEIADVAGWLGHALEHGYLEELEPGPDQRRRFRLVPRGRRVLTRWRRRDDALA